MASKARSIGRSARSARDALEESLRQLEKQLPKNLSRMVKQLRANLKTLQSQVERLRAERDERWNSIQLQVRRDAAKLFRRLEQAVEPKAGRSGTKRKAGARKRSAKPRAAARAVAQAGDRMAERVSNATRAAARSMPLAAAPRASGANARPIGEPPTTS